MICFIAIVLRMMYVWITDNPQIVLDLRRDIVKGLQIRFRNL